MPNAVVQSFAQKSGKTTAEVETLWKKAEAITNQSDVAVDDKYAYLVGVLKKMLKLEDFGIGVAAPAALNVGMPSTEPENSGVFAPKIGDGKIQKRKHYVEWLKGH